MATALKRISAKDKAVVVREKKVCSSVRVTLQAQCISFCRPQCGSYHHSNASANETQCAPFVCGSAKNGFAHTTAPDVLPRSRGLVSCSPSTHSGTNVREETNAAVEKLNAKA